MSQKMIDCKEDQGRLLSLTAAEEVLNWQSFIPPQLSIVPAVQSPSNDSDMIDSSDFDSDDQLADLTGLLMANLLPLLPLKLHYRCYKTSTRPGTINHP
ncbi:hypothetical protein GH714_033315 [Hevea brasiliensis]|uniref:Uncharacterized protein n=1 Tax=Hevea brasiliensis TaxID=3981 RepID=A0A6A6N6I7_HEVBR|nr:hypothetical protein GH714_033315 [Hevea brasiliensis]